MYVIYRYVDVRDGSVLYVGKTKRDLKERIAEHALESKFVSILPYSQIQFYVVTSQVLMDIHEKYWIHMYQPKLNVVDRVAGEEHLPLGFSFGNICWRDYEVGRVLAVRRDTQSKKDLVFMRLSLLAQEDKLYENAESFLEYSFEQYAFGYVQEEKGKLSFSWDLGQYPLPDCLKIYSDMFGFYIRAEYDTSLQTYVLWHSFSVIRRLWQKGSDAIREARMDVTKQILDLEEQLDEHVLAYCG